MKYSRLLTRLFFLTLVLVVPCEAGLKIYYLRHAEQGGNVMKDWAEIPRNQWPDYVGKSDRFTPLGAAQAANIPAKLAPFRFDFIAVSPTWRTRQTILPYLKAHDRKAEIWPELIEFSTRGGLEKLIGTDGLPPPADDLFTGGKPIDLPEEERDWFILRPDATTEPKLRYNVRAGATEPDEPITGNRSRDRALGAADRTALPQRTIARLREQFGGKDQSVLLVGHGNAGRHLLRMLTGATPPDHVTNTGIWMAEEQPDGTFRLMLLNDHPVE